MKRLAPGDLLPQLVGRWIDGSPATIPDDLAASATVLLFYRGLW